MITLHRGFTPTFPSSSSANSGFGLDSCQRLHKFTCCKKPSQNLLSLIGIKASQRRCLCIEFESPTVGSSSLSIRSSYEINVSTVPDVDPRLHTQVILLIIFAFAVWNLSLKIYELVDIALLEVASLSFLWLHFKLGKPYLKISAFSWPFCGKFPGCNLLLFMLIRWLLVYFSTKYELLHLTF